MVPPLHKEVIEMAKKVEGYIKLQIPAGKATPAPPVDQPGQHGVNIVELQSSSTLRQQIRDMIIPVVITVYNDRSFSFIKDTTGSSSDQESMQHQIRSAFRIRIKVATITKAQVEEIAKTKMPDLNAANCRVGSCQHDRWNTPVLWE